MNSQQTEITIAYPEAVERHLHIRVGACRLRLTRGGGLAWVTGTYSDPTGGVPSRVILDGGSARITQEAQLGSLLGIGTWCPHL